MIHHSTNKVIVAGSINMDIVASIKHHPKVGETVEGNNLKFFPGGKGANQAVASAKIGAKTYLIGKLGKDNFGDQLRKFLGDNNVDLTFTHTALHEPSGTALIAVSKEGKNTIIVVPGANNALTPQDIKNTPIKKGCVLVSQFEIPQETVTEFFKKGKSAGATTILNPAPAKACSKELLSLTDILILNETELAFFLKQDFIDTNSTDALLNAIKDIQNTLSQIVIVTLGEKGAVALMGKVHQVIPARKVKVVDTTGAGDCFVGSIAARLSLGDNIESALQYGIIASSISVQRHGAGTSMPTAKEVEKAKNIILNS